MAHFKNDDKKDEEIKKLKKEKRELQEELRRYKKKVADDSVVKRWQIGKYLHDKLAQQLVSAKITISFLTDEISKDTLLKKCKEVINILNESINEVRDLSHDIIPMDVEKEGVHQAFNHLKLQSERLHGVNCILETEERILQKINRRKVATNLYNIAQEAIKNAISHGEAKNIKIALIEHDQQLYLHVKDDGKGFEYTEKSSGMGLKIMKHRAEELGGSLRIKKGKDESEYTTVVTCSIPLKALDE